MGRPSRQHSMASRSAAQRTQPPATPARQPPPPPARQPPCTVPTTADPASRSSQASSPAQHIPRRYASSSTLSLDKPLPPTPPGADTERFYHISSYSHSNISSYRAPSPSATTASTRTPSPRPRPRRRSPVPAPVTTYPPPTRAQRESRLMHAHEYHAAIKAISPPPRRSMGSRASGRTSQQSMTRMSPAPSPFPPPALSSRPPSRGRSATPSSPQIATTVRYTAAKPREYPRVITPPPAPTVRPPRRPEAADDFAESPVLGLHDGTRILPPPVSRTSTPANPARERRAAQRQSVREKQLLEQQRKQQPPQKLQRQQSTRGRSSTDQGTGHNAKMSAAPTSGPTALRKAVAKMFQLSSHSSR
ncbi:hypothetical protein Micbo1qcDRAFT_168005 [Microdochium bolleyi]|uniref:Uncharacterized protein n=1 Tax=Microdochium bolleyi TaxID=196109 RepID=A0A136IPQ8_9PEZI|nr:hypothetical protein Micbo1qcDRAFT_168005 [Microdochium bolleyi]